MCFQQEAINKCGCYINGYPKLDGRIPCINLTQNSCVIQKYNDYLNEISAICGPSCPLECNSGEYQIATSFSQYPTRQYAENSLINNPIIASKFPNGTLNYEIIKQSVLSLNVFYDTLSYTEYIESPKLEIFDLVSNIGGIIGVFVGASLLSVFEIVEVAIEILAVLFKKTSVTVFIGSKGLAHKKMGIPHKKVGIPHKKMGIPHKKVGIPHKKIFL